MSLLDDVLDAVNQAIPVLHDRLARLPPASDQYHELLDKVNFFDGQQIGLDDLVAERTQTRSRINADIDRKLEEERLRLEEERKRRFDVCEKHMEQRLRHDFRDLMFFLEAPPPSAPVLEETLAEEPVQPETLPFYDDTGDVVKQYAIDYRYRFQRIPEDRSFFYALALSQGGKDVFHPNLNVIKATARTLRMQAKGLLPESLASVDRIIHLSSFEKDVVVVLDTSLQVILTNALSSKLGAESPDYDYLVVYDSGSHEFAALSNRNFLGQLFCRKCFSFARLDPHSCQRLCPICLRFGNDVVTCRKPNTDDTAQVCRVCKAYCQTPDCYAAHKRICPRPVTGLRDGIVQLLRNLRS